MALTAKEREVRGFIRPPGQHAHGLIPHRVVHVQDALDPQAFAVFRRIVDEGRKISNPKYTLREMSNQEVADAENVSLDVVERCLKQIRERKFLQLEPSIHGDVGTHRHKGMHAGEKRRKSVYRVVCGDYKDWLADPTLFPLYNGRHLVLGSGKRVGSMFTAEMIAAWHIGDEQGGLKAAAEAGAAMKAAAAGDVVAAAGPPAEMPAPILMKMEGRVSGEMFAAMNVWLPGSGQAACYSFQQSVALQVGRAVPDEELIAHLNAVGKRIRDRKAAGKPAPMSPSRYLFCSVVADIRAGPASFSSDARWDEIERQLEEFIKAEEAKKQPKEVGRR